MSLTQDCDSFQDLCCDQCHLKKFPSRFEYNLHHSAHKSEPIVSLVKLSELSLEKLKHQSYKVNNGVARRTRNLVSPLRISLKKQEGSIEFQVVKKNNDRKSDHGHHGEHRRSSGLLELDAGPGVTTSKRDADGGRSSERHSSSKSRTNHSHLPALQYRDEKEKELDDNANLSRKNTSGSGHEHKSGGVSVTKRKSSAGKSDASTDGTDPPKILSVFSAGSEEANHSKKNSSTHATAESDKQKLNKTTILKKLSGLGFSLIPKTTDATDIEEKPKVNDSAEKENKQEKVNPAKKSGLEIFVRSKNNSHNTSRHENNKNLQSNSVYVVEIADEKTSADNRPGIEKGKVKGIANGSEEHIGHKDNSTPVPKKHGRGKNSNSNRKGTESDKKGGARDVDPNEFLDSGVTDYIKSACESSIGDIGGIKESSKDFDFPNSATIDAKGRESSTSMGVESSPTEQLQPDFIASRLERPISPLSLSESQYNSLGEHTNRLQDSNDCGMLLSSVQNGEDGESTTFNSVNIGDGFRSEPFGEGNNGAGVQGDEVGVSFSSLPSEGSSLDEPQQDSVMSVENTSGNGESLSQSFLHNFLNESQTTQVNIQPEGSEYMALERLAQVSGLDGQHGQVGYDMNTGEPTTPMEQLSQQVQRLPNPAMNVIPHHHMQAPQPPQLHAGLPPLAPQQAASFDHLGHMQPPLPPPLYQGFNMYNQNFAAQGPQQLPPRPPMLQQRPQIPPRGFPNMAPIPRARNRYPAKRNSVRLPSPQEIPQKQRRIEPPVPARSQPTVSPTTKIPSGITVTPARKNLEASKVANVLASRGITVTPSSGIPRQTSPKSHQRGNPILNIGQGVSITANSNNRSGNNFVVPSPRRSSPIVNPDVERPERCATVDLTLDDDPVPTTQIARVSGTRFPCNQCPKVFAMASALENHKATHKTAGVIPYKCEKCAAHYPNAAGLQQHRVMFHKAKPTAPELAIPIVDLNHPGAREQLAKCGINGFLPLSQLQTNSLGYFGLPIVQLDTTKEKAVPNLNIFGASNVLVLGKMKSLSQPQIR